MALKSETWLVVVILLIAGGLIAASMVKHEATSPMMTPRVASSSPVQGIKQDHDAADMQKIAATKPTSAIIEMPQPIAVKEAFAVQVFSFKDKARADAALKMLKEKGYPGYIMMSDLGVRGVFYRVRVGSFTTEEEARKNLDAITRDFKSGIIVAE